MTRKVRLTFELIEDDKVLEKRGSVVPAPGDAYDLAEVADTLGDTLYETLKAFLAKP